MAEADYHPLVIKYGPWSDSKVRALETCTQQFVNRYVRKIKPTAKLHPSALVGVVVHAVLETALKTPGVDLYREMLHQAEKHNLTNEERIQASAKVDACADFLKRWNDFVNAKGVGEPLVEQQLAIDVNHEPCPFDDPKALFRGIVDLGQRIVQDYLVIVDHKSGRWKAIKEHSTQFYSYMALSYFNYPWAQGVQCGINLVGSPKVDWFPRHDSTPGSWSRADIRGRVNPWLTAYLNSTVERLTRVDALAEGETLTKPNRLCEWCGYLPECPDGQERGGVASNKKKRALPVKNI